MIGSHEKGTAGPPIRLPPHGVEMTTPARDAQQRSGLIDLGPADLAAQIDWPALDSP
jgi:hypothetical protein